jgi:hypothetical protein
MGGRGRLGDGSMVSSLGLRQILIYILAVSGLFALLYGEAAYTHAAGSALNSGLVTFSGVFLSLYVPRRLFRYNQQMNASLVLTRLVQRGVVGSGVLLVTTLLVWLVIGRLDDPGVFGELYLFSAIGVFIFQGLGETMTGHAMYLQQTHQYNSNQLVAVLLTITLLLFTLVLYFLAFDLGRPPVFHAYFRDLTAITLTLIGYGRAVYLIAHH